MTFEVSDETIAKIWHNTNAAALLCHDDTVKVSCDIHGCESPIELIMLFALKTAFKEPNNVMNFYSSSDHLGDALRVSAQPPPQFVICPQAEIGQYRVDFLMAYMHHDFSWSIAVECDGHEYHDRTKEQAARDKSRDRTLLHHGVPVMRFTGSEIWRDANKCADQVLSNFISARLRHYENKRRAEGALAISEDQS